MSQLPENPIDHFRAWFAEAVRAEVNDPNAMALATATPDGLPSLRMVLLKDFDERGFVFYTNLESRKGGELARNPQAALCLHWKSLRRSVRIEGAVVPVSDEEADAYFQSRARASRIGAWASRQSRPMAGMIELEKRVAKFGLKFGISEIPRPDFWSGFRVVPLVIEFWTDKPFRLHERKVYRRDSAEGDGPVAEWRIEQLFP